MNFGSLDGENGEDSGVGFMEISKIFATHDLVIFGTISISSIPISVILFEELNGGCRKYSW